MWFKIVIQQSLNMDGCVLSFLPSFSVLKRSRFNLECLARRLAKRLGQKVQSWQGTDVSERVNSSFPLPCPVGAVSHLHIGRHGFRINNADIGSLTAASLGSRSAGFLGALSENRFLIYPRTYPGAACFCCSVRDCGMNDSHNLEKRRFSCGNIALETKKHRSLAHK